MQTNVESQISAMAYLDLIVRSVTEPGLIQIVVKFLLDEEKFDGQRILDVLVERLNSNDTRVSYEALITDYTTRAMNEHSNKSRKTRFDKRYLEKTFLKKFKPSTSRLLYVSR